MVSLRSQQFPIPLAFVLVLLAAAIQTIPVVVSQSSLNEEVDFQRSTYLVAPAGCQSLWKRAVGAIPLSSFSDASVRPEVARRAVGSVADPGNLCDPISAIKSATKLQARSIANSDPQAAQMHSFDKRSSMKQDPKKPVVAPKTTPKKPTGHAKPNAAYKFSRGAAW